MRSTVQSDTVPRMHIRSTLVSLALIAVGCSSTEPVVSAPPASSERPVVPPPVASPASSAIATAPLPPAFEIKPIALPGGTADGVGMDFILFDPNLAAIWVPAGNTGFVDVVDTATGTVKHIDGFPTKEMERNGKKRIVGPSSVSLGDGVVFVGNRGDAAICAIDPKKLTKGTCSAKLDSMPDATVYVAPTSEVWITTPRDKSIRILDAKTLKQKEKLSFDGEPEGYAVDATRGRFYTNLEDADKTLAIDLKTHKTVATWKPGCGKEGPHGLRLAEADGFLFVACSTRVEALDVGHDGAVLSSVDTGDGVDDLDYAASTRNVYVGAAKAAVLVVAHVDAKGILSVVAQVPTVEGARNPAVDGAGRVYLTHAKGSELLLATPTQK